MESVKVKLSTEQIEFLKNFRLFGFDDESSLIRKAIENFKYELELKMKLTKSGELYSEIYNSDKDLQRLTNSAISEWPE